MRHLLHRRGYSIKKEWFLEEEGKYYVVIKGCPLPEGETERYEDEFSYVYGKLLLDERNPVLLAYMQKECAKKESILAQMKAQTEEKETRIIRPTQSERKNVDGEWENWKKKSKIAEHIFTGLIPDRNQAPVSFCRLLCEKKPRICSLSWQKRRSNPREYSEPKRFVIMRRKMAAGRPKASVAMASAPKVLKTVCHA